MGISYEGLKSIGLSEHTKKVIGNDNDEVIKYFINTDIGWNYLDLYNWDNVGWHIEERKTAIKSTGHSNEDISFIRELFQKIDKLIDLDFVELDTDNGSEIDIYSIEYSSEFSADTVGEAKIQSSSTGHWWDILWKDTDGKKNINNLDKHTIAHEIGHALGLSHPYESPYDNQWNNDDTIMSYNIGSNGWSPWFTEDDILALQSLWGREDDDSNLYFTKSFKDYQFRRNNENIFLIKSEIGLEDVSLIEKLNFKDKTLEVEKDIKQVFELVDNIDDKSGKIFRLYNAAFGRFPDFTGLKYWINENNSGISSYQRIARYFVNSQEFLNLYGEDQSNDEFIDSIYKNVLDRSPDDSGKTYWLNQLNSDFETQSEVLMGFSESNENKVLFTEQTGLT